MGVDADGGGDYDGAGGGGVVGNEERDVGGREGRDDVEAAG